MSDLRAELLSLVQSARELLLVHRDAGATGFPLGNGWAPSEAPPVDRAAFAPVAHEPAPPPVQAAPPVAAPPTAPQAAPSPQPPPGRPALAPQGGPASRSASAAPAPSPGQAPQAPARQAPPPSQGGELRLQNQGPPPSSRPASPSVAPKTDAARHRLELMRAEAAGCTSCVLHTGRRQAVFARGNPLADLCFVGEGPGADEDAVGEPFVGKAGQLLDRMIAAMGYGRDEVYIANVVKCRPPQNRTPTPEEMASCIPFLHEQLALVQPKVIVALGGTAAKGLLNTNQGIKAMRGQWRLYRATIPVMPTFHPAYLLRDPAAKREVWADLQAVLERLGRPVPGRRGS